MCRDTKALVVSWPQRSSRDCLYPAGCEGRTVKDMPPPPTRLEGEMRGPPSSPGFFLLASEPPAPTLSGVVKHGQACQASGAGSFGGQPKAEGHRAF